jgi:hypothetical protein
MLGRAAEVPAMPTLEVPREHTSHKTEVLDALRAQHRALDIHLDEMCRLARGDDRSDERDAMRACWAKLEDEVLAHLNLEEMHLLPAIGKKHPDNVREIRAEHDHIRGLLGEIGVELDLHMARAEQIDRLAAGLRSHAIQEEGGIYAWAEDELSASTKELFLRRLRERIANLTGP